MKKMNNVMRNTKNLIFDLLVIVGGLAIIVMICKAVFNNTDNKITTAKVNAAEISTDEAKYSETITEIVDEMDDELNEMLYGQGKEESNKENICYEKNINYLGAGMYKVEYIFTIYGNDELTYEAYVDAEEEDGIGVFILKGIRVDEYILSDIYPEFFE